jgi:hypothetical protein
MQIALARSLGEYMGRLSQMQPALAVCPSFAIHPVLMFSERAQKASTTDAAAQELLKHTSYGRVSFSSD